MKLICFFLLILITSISCTQYKNSTLFVNVNYGNKNNAFLPLNELTIYKNKSLIKKIIKKDSFLKSQIKIDSMKKGKYTFEYKNLFGQQIKKQFHIKNKEKIDSITIYPNHFEFKKYYNNSIIKNLKNETIKITFLSQGCFLKVSDSIIISNKKGNYYALFDNKQVPINKKTIDKLIDFEAQLYAIPNNGKCTTLDTYTINFKNKTKVIKDGTCVWNGWYNLGK